jgi:hypothetical protein
MLRCEPGPDDDCDFIGLVTRLIAGALSAHQPRYARLFKIDNWFDHKWLGFSGKALGAVGVWNDRLTLPPFVANRVVHQWNWERDENGVYGPAAGGPDIHHRGASGGNLSRSVRSVAPHSALFWFSGNTNAMGRGSVMAYIPIDDEDWAWYLSLVRDRGWRIAKRNNIQEFEIRSLERHADQVR